MGLNEVDALSSSNHWVNDYYDKSINCVDGSDQYINYHILLNG